MLSRREVKKRIKEQRPLPDEVLAQYPELFKGMDIKPVKVARNPKATGHKAGVSPHIDELEFRLREAWEQYWKYRNKALRDSSAHQKTQDREAAKWWYNKLGEYQAEWDAVMEEVRREIQSNPSSPSAIKRHVRKHLDEDQREYRKMIQDDDELKRWMEKNPKASKIPKGIKVTQAKNLNLGDWAYLPELGYLSLAPGHAYQVIDKSRSAMWFMYQNGTTRRFVFPDTEVARITDTTLWNVHNPPSAAEEISTWVTFVYDGNKYEVLYSLHNASFPIEIRDADTKEPIFFSEIPVPLYMASVDALTQHYKQTEMLENPYSSRSRFKHERIESPAKFDKRSFRTITQPDGTEVTIGCPTGKYDAKRKRCKVGTRAQRILKPKRRRKK
ncbi:MAG: hypothetical protein KGJ90_02610 [Patescibacteria group bacterium]|nr:hypothetical protein [Patescibacteria group bacterium]